MNRAPPYAWPVARLSRRGLLSLMSGGLAMGLVSGPGRADVFSLAPVSYVVEDEATYERALSYAARLTRSALVYVGAAWCPICRTLERTTLRHHGVSSLLQSIALVKIDVTRMDGDSKALLHRFGVEGPPTLFLVETRSGREHAHTRLAGRVPPQDLIQRLRPFAG